MQKIIGIGIAILIVGVFVFTPATAMIGSYVTKTTGVNMEKSLWDYVAPQSETKKVLPNCIKAEDIPNDGDKSLTITSLSRSGMLCDDEAESKDTNSNGLSHNSSVERYYIADNFPDYKNGFIRLKQVYCYKDQCFVHYAEEVKLRTEPNTTSKDMISVSRYRDKFFTDADKNTVLKYATILDKPLQKELYERGYLMRVIFKGGK